MPSEQPNSARAMWRLIMREPALLAWAIHILLIPIYVFKSGLPQPGDVFVLVLVPIALFGWDGKLSHRARKAFRPLLWFTVWVCIVNYSWAFITGNFGVFGLDTYLLYPLYYVYNALILLTAFVLYRRFGEVFVRITVFIVMGTIYLQVLLTFVFRSSFSRGSVLFNNPNQLGYYALLAGTLIALTHKRLNLKRFTSASALTGCAYLALVSASRAAAAGIAILLFLLVFSNPRVIILASIAATILIIVGGPVESALESSQQRLLNKADNHLTFFEERGYDRIVDHKEYLLFGAGEGGLTRFQSAAHVAMEIHSSAGTIVFSYGIIGTLLFLVFGVRVIRGARLRSTLMLVPPLLYTIAHQGLRFTMLWILLAIFVSLKEQVPQRKPVGKIAVLA